MRVNPSELNSWKEIAARLDVSVRTAQLWEKERGLPVRRLPGPRGRVFVVVDDLEKWLLAAEADGLRESAELSSENGRGKLGSTTGRFALTGRLSTALGLLAAVALAAAYVMGAAAPDPAERVARIEFYIQPDATPIGSRPDITLFAEDGERIRVLHFANAVTDATLTTDHQGRQQILVGLGVGDDLRKGHLALVDTNGEEIWARDMVDPDRRTGLVSAGYEHGDFLEVTDILPTTLQEERVVAVVAQDDYFFASRVTLLSQDDGETIADYWHGGGLGYGRAQLTSFPDADSPMLIVSGYNNRLRGFLAKRRGESAVLFVMDLEQLARWGQSQSWPPAWPDLPIRLPRWYYFVPRPNETENGGLVETFLVDHDGDGTDEIVAQTVEGRIYYFETNGDYRSSTASHLYTDRNGTEADIPTPIRVQQSHVDLDACLRGRASPEQLGRLADLPDPVVEGSMRDWTRRCAEITQNDAPVDLGLHLRRIWLEPPTVDEVSLGGPAERAGVRPGDVVVGVEGNVITSGIDVAYELETLDPEAKTVRLSIQRGTRVMHLDVEIS